MKESKAYKTYLGFATSAVPPKIARKFKKASPSKKDSVLVPGDEEPVLKGKRVKRAAKKSSTTLATGIIIRESPVTTKAKGKGKENVDVAHGKGIEQLSNVVLGNDEDDSNEEQESGDEGSDQEKASDEQESESEQDDENEDDDQEDEESDHENESEDDETKSVKGDQGIDDSTDQFDDDADTSDAEIVSPLDVHVHHEVPRSQAPTLLIILVSVIPKSSPVITNIPQSSHTFTPIPIQATPTPPPTIETTNPLSNVPDFASIFQFNDRIIALENDVAELKKDHFHTQVTSLVDSHLDASVSEKNKDKTKIPYLSTPGSRPSLTFKLLKGTRTNYAELEYDFEECYKSLLEKLDWENPEGGDYPFDLSKPLPLVMSGRRQRVPVDYFINNDLKYLRMRAVSTITSRQSTEVQKKQKGKGRRQVMTAKESGYSKDKVERPSTWKFEELCREKSATVYSQPDTTRPDLRKRHPYTPYKDPQGFIYVDDFGRNRLMRTDELYKFSDGTLTRLLTSLNNITNNINIEYLPKRQWSNLEKKRAHYMIKDINKLLKERRLMRSLERFVGGRLYETDPRLLQRPI
ncbi:hypothetical protein Tco_1410736 [Tanacetum coccineum]